MMHGQTHIKLKNVFAPDDLAPWICAPLPRFAFELYYYEVFPLWLVPWLSHMMFMKNKLNLHLKFYLRSLNQNVFCVSNLMLPAMQTKFCPIFPHHIRRSSGPVQKYSYVPCSHASWFFFKTSWINFNSMIYFFFILWTWSVWRLQHWQVDQPHRHFVPEYWCTMSFVTIRENQK